jgi:putative membrane protein
MKNTIQVKTALSLATISIATLLGAISCNNAQKSADTVIGSVPSSDTIRANKDAEFLIKVAEIDLKEIQLGQLVQQKATMTHVKDLGKMMQDDHSKALNDLTALALKKSITIPTTLDSNAQGDYNKLNNLSGSDFDKKYCDMMINGHKDAIALFEKESTDASDADIRQMVTMMLPALQKHLDHAVACRKECGKME